MPLLVLRTYLKPLRCVLPRLLWSVVTGQVDACSSTTLSSTRSPSILFCQPREAQLAAYSPTSYATHTPSSSPMPLQPKDKYTILPLRIAL